MTVKSMKTGKNLLLSPEEEMSLIKTQISRVCTKFLPFVINAPHEHVHEVFVVELVPPMIITILAS